MSYIYLSIDQAKAIHLKTVEVSGGGATGQLEMGKLEGVLAHIQNDTYYPDFSTKLTHLFFCACKFHSFEDGNKRIAAACFLHFLDKNSMLTINGSPILSNEALATLTLFVAISRTEEMETVRSLIISILNRNQSGL